MREVTISSWCDRCADENTREPATRIFTIGVVESETVRPQLRVIELCDVHGKEFGDLGTFAQTRGADPAKLPDVPRTTSPSEKHPKQIGPCPACGHYGSSPAAMATHVYRRHLNTDPPPAPTVCPDCGYETPSATGMGAHRTAAHQTSSATDAYAALTATPRRRRARAAE